MTTPSTEALFAGLMGFIPAALILIYILVRSALQVHQGSKDR